MPSSLPRIGKKRRGAKPRATRARSPTYHHGDLRRALLDATLELVSYKGPEGLTLRAAARLAKVSDAAPYHHFADKEALLAAVAEEGFRKLHAELHTTFKNATDLRTRAREMGIAYVLFAAKNPAHFRVMVSRTFAHHASHPELAKSAAEAFELVRDTLMTAVSREQSGEVPGEEVIYGSWAIVHGLAFLAIDGHLGPIAGDEARLRSLVQRIMLLYGEE